MRGQLTLIKRSSPACPGCNVMKAMLDGEGIEYSTIDLTEEPEAQDTYGVTGIPALVINGEIKFTGVTPIEEITAALTTKKEDE